MQCHRNREPMVVQTWLNHSLQLPTLLVMLVKADQNCTSAKSDKVQSYPTSMGEGSIIENSKGEYDATSGLIILLSEYQK